MTGWVDSHCHVYDERMPGGPDAAVAEAEAAGVDTMIAVGCDRDTSLAALALAARHPGVFATVGLHPHDARLGVATIRDLLPASAPAARTPPPFEGSRLQKTATHSTQRVAGAGFGGDRGGSVAVAVGECGLDYHYDHSPRDVQRDVFAVQIDLAHELGLPLVIHTREAWDDTFAILDAQGVPERTIFHCFTGGPDEVVQCLARGAYVSFSGIVTFTTATAVREAAALCPLDRTLVETDSPYLAPTPHRGKPNRPAWVPLVGAGLAVVHDVPVEQVQLSTGTAARRAFGL